jgi:hypothetical protein
MAEPERPRRHEAVIHVGRSVSASTASLVRFDADGNPAEMLDALRSDAAIVVERLLAPETVEALRAELDPYFEATPYGDNDFHGDRTRRVGTLIARSPTCGHLALHPLLLSLAGGFLGPFCDEVQLHFTQAVDIHPGETAQPLHRDRGVWGGYLTRAVETQLSTIWALDDFTAANGATLVVPGSQAWHRDRQPDAAEIVPAEMPAGSVLIYSGSVLHGGGANTSDGTRRAALLHYTLGWLRQEENQYLACPPEVATTLPAELRRLIGYQRGGPLLGFFSPPGPPGSGFELASPEILFNQR